MKKYIKPECRCYDVELQGMIANSSKWLQYGGRTSTSGITEASADERKSWGSLW
jgi:hypothetical protein